MKTVESHMIQIKLCKVSSAVSLLMMLGNNQGIKLCQQHSLVQDREVHLKEHIVLLMEVDPDLEEDKAPILLPKEHTEEERHLGIDQLLAIVLSPI